MNTEVIDKQSIKPLYLQIRERLMREADKNPDYRFPSERELCRLYGVSRPTVQKALSYFIEHDLIVRRPGIGTMLCKGKSISPEAITAVKVMIRSDWIGWEDDIYFAKILAGILSCIRKNGRQLTIQQYSDQAKHLLLESPEICSMWLSPEAMEIETMKILAQNGHKAISINREIDYPNISYATTDHISGAKMAVEYLLERGHNDILFIGSLLDYQVNDKRYQGYLSAFRPEVVIPDIEPLNLESISYTDELKSKLPKIFSTTKRPTAIFIANGHFQEAVIEILANLGIVTPKDISIISFDNIEDVSEKYGITVVQQQLSKISKHAFKAILQKGTIKEKIKPRILERKSVKQLK
jgi:DNA-binding LacI/PurR family transcriptional regulator